MNVRPIAEDELELVAEFLAHDESRQFGRPSRVGADDVRGWFAGVDLANDSWLVEDDGLLVALAWVDASGGPRGVAVGAVDVEQRGRGFGSRLVELTEARLRDCGATRVHNIVLAPDPLAPELLSSRGYREVRRFWEMTIELGDEPPPEPVLPEGLQIEQFGETWARSYHAALEEAFAEHWGHRPESFETWWERQLRKHDFEPSLWWFVRDGSDVAAAMRNDPRRSGGG